MSCHFKSLRRLYNLLLCLPFVLFHLLSTLENFFFFFFFFLQSTMISCHFCCSTQVDYHFSFLFTEFLLLQRGKLRERSRDQDAISHIIRTFYAPALCLHIGVVGEGYYIANTPSPLPLSSSLLFFICSPSASTQFAYSPS